MSNIYLDRLDRVRVVMAEQGVDVLLASVGHDLPYLTGYMAMPLERLTMLVVPRDGDRVITAGEIVLCDFGGTMAGYCSDTTRCVFTGQPSAEIAEAYAVLLDAQQASVASATVGTPCQDVDRAARQIIADAGYGDFFVHRTGHGIGMEEHEDPYMVQGNGAPLAPGHAYSVEPGIYVPGRWGMRLEDIVVATADVVIEMTSYATEPDEAQFARSAS